MRTTLASVLPLIRGFQEATEVASDTPHLSDGDAPVTREFLDDMRIVYAYDEGPTYRWVRSGDLVSLGVTPDQLDEQAYANLLQKCRGLTLSVEPSPSGLTHLVRIGEDLEASLLMNGTLWNHLAQQLPGKLVAVCPTRDVLAFGCLATPGSLQELMTSAERVLSSTDTPVSTLVLEWEGDGWSPRADA